MEDGALVDAALAGNPYGYPAIFDRHAAGVHDLALAALRDERMALEVVDSTFLEAGLRLHGLAEPNRLAVWLLAVTRRQAALRADGVGAATWAPAFPDDGQGHLARLVWDAVGELPLRDRTLLDLELRHGLDGTDLADAMGLPPAQAEDLRRQVHDLERALSNHLVARTSEGRCGDLSRLLKGWDGRFDSQDRRHLGRHVEGCPVCTHGSINLPPAFALYGTALAAPYPTSVRDRVLDRVVVPDGPDAGPDGTSTGPQPEPRPAAPRIVLKVLPAAAPGHEPAAGSAATSEEAVPAPPPPPSAAPQASQPAAGGADDAGAPPLVGSERWMANGFPPPSFALGATEPTRRFAGSRSRGLVAVAAAIVLLAAALLIAGLNDAQDTALRSDSTVTSVLDLSPPPEPEWLTPIPSPGPSTSVATVLAQPSTPIPEAPPATGPAAPPTTGAPPPAAAPGVLAAGFESVRLPRVDSTAGTQSGKLPLRNTGPSPLSYTTRSSFGGLTVDKPTGTIDPAATTELTITLDGGRAPEGEFSATLTFEGTGGTRQVGVTSTVGRPPAIKDDAGEPCTNGVNPCSRLIKLVPVNAPAAQPTPCNTPWRYSMNIEDESALKTVKVDANLPGRDADLKRGGAGPWQSDVYPPVPVAASLTFTVEAVDAFDFFRSRTVRSIVC